MSVIRRTIIAFELKQASWADMTALNYMRGFRWT